MPPASPDFTRPASLEELPAHRPAPKVDVSLFWRTFILIAILLVGSTVAWFQTFRALEYEPRAVQTAQQIASLVNLSRAALLYSDSIARISLVKTLADQEGVRIQPREPKDMFQVFAKSALDERITEELALRLGSGTTIASSVNGEDGLWVGFAIDGDSYWLLMDRSRVTPVGGRTWLIWLITAGALSLTGAAIIARLINRPLKQLSFAASRLRDGNFDTSKLDEHAVTSEIRAVNIGFNRMAEQLAKIEQDRAIMLAGISHDLRTPLARLRLETEMSVSDETARAHMAADIVQLDAIIDKFLDYARPDHVQLKPVGLHDLIETCTFPIEDNPEFTVNTDVPANITVLADEVELARVIGNLLENARRYGKTPDSGVAVVDINAKTNGQWVLIKVRDHGVGVPPKILDQLTKPFFRGDDARTEATGAGLGLSIVEKTILRMGGTFSLANSSTGGLAAHIRLKKG